MAMGDALRRTFELPGDHRRSGALQGLRGIAVALVFCVHYDTLMRGYLPAGSTAAAISAFFGHVGHAGVDLFFVLSGMLIYTLVLRPFDFRRFVVRRVQRIYPCFVGVLAIYTVLALIRPELGKLPAEPLAAAAYWVANLILLPGVFPIVPIVTVSWSLSYEVFFYIVMPAIAVATGLRHRQPRSRVLALCAIAAVGFALASLHVLPQKRMLMFVAGMLVCELVDAKWFVARVSSRWETVAAAAFVVSLPAAFWLSGGLGKEGWSAAALLVLFVADAALVACAYCGGGPVSRFLAVAPLRWLGNISYSFYLLHGLVLRLLITAAGLVLAPSPNLAGYLLLLPIAWFAAVFCSTILFVLVEKRFSLAPPRPAPAPAAQPAVLRASVSL
jgi:exopolysaccharide production protein ExoZ